MIVKRLSYADIVEQQLVLEGSQGAIYGARLETVAYDGQRTLSFDSPEQQTLFEDLDITIPEFSYYLEAVAAVDGIEQAFPQGELAHSFGVATKAKLEKLLKEQAAHYIAPTRARIRLLA